MRVVKGSEKADLYIDSKGYVVDDVKEFTILQHRLGLGNEHPLKGVELTEIGRQKWVLFGKKGKE